MPALDQNQNQNQSIGLAIAERRFRARYNTDVYARLFNTGGNLVPAPTPNYGGLVPPRNYPPYDPNSRFDAELRACLYVRDFELQFAAAGNTWFDRYVALLNATNIPGVNMSQAAMNQQVLQILDLALERDDRFSEVMDQDDADGAINYWLGMISIEPSRYPNTFLLLRVGQRIGEHVVMCLKGFFRSPRPPQLCPAIEPMIDPPNTPSFPAGHALQSFLMSFLLAYSLPNLPGQQMPLAANLAFPNSLGSGPLIDLAKRVGENRIVAGIHYPIDIDAGTIVAIACFTDLLNVPSVQQLMTAVGNEWPQYQ